MSNVAVAAAAAVHAFTPVTHVADLGPCEIVRGGLLCQVRTDLGTVHTVSGRAVGVFHARMPTPQSDHDVRRWLFKEAIASEIEEEGISRHS